MAIRPVFEALASDPFVKETSVKFEFFSGLSVEQGRRSADSLHRAAHALGMSPCLEVSSRSRMAEGLALSSFRLTARVGDLGPATVECLFQGSKVFERGGPYQDLYGVDSSAARRDARIRQSGRIVGFVLGRSHYPATPATAFYNWLYASALTDNESLLLFAMRFRAFTDIAFNPQKSLNCQARSLAVAVGMRAAGVTVEGMRDFERFRELKGPSGEEPETGNLFDP